jgi:uncharacterized lipoprotein YbaY/heat shock protein HslJ
VNNFGAALLTMLLLGLISTGWCQEAQQKTARNLAGTSWQLVQFQGGDDKTLTPADRTKYTIAFDEGGGVSVRIDCNRGRGTWKSSGGSQLEFGPLALTRVMCPPAPLTDRITKDWPYVRSYVLRSGHLFLSLMADGGIYEFEPMAQEKAGMALVKGTATYRERMALPPDAVLEATLEDVSRADAPAAVIGKAQVGHPGNPPISFAIPYDPTRIDASHRYAVRAQILVDGKLFFTTDQHYPVLTNGHGDEIDVLLRRAGSSTTTENTTEPPASPPKSEATAALENTYWKLTRLGDTSVQAGSQRQEPHFCPAPRHTPGQRLGRLQSHHGRI